MEPTNVSHIPISQRRLEHFMKSHDGSWGEDVIRDVILRADTIVQTIFPNGTIPRFTTLMLYYEILVNVYRAKKKKQPKTLRAILTCDIFHRCLLACAAAEQVTHTSGTASKLFPADRVLESSGITAFDLSHTITTNFVRHERSFPGYFNRHLNSFKEQLLESLAWKKGSSLFNSLLLVRPSLSPEINRLGLLIPPSFHETKLDLETTSPSKACAETKLNIFFREISMLGAVRIHGMAERLILSQRTRENVYSLFQRILNERTHLFFNRHIDQIMLCCFYIVTQRSKLNLSFTEIIHSYRQQPECRPRVFLSVFVDCPLAGHDDDGPSTTNTGQEHVGITTFYNDIFIPSVWPLVLELDTDGATVKNYQSAEVDNTKDGHQAQCLGSPTIVPFPRFPVMHLDLLHPRNFLRVYPLSSSEIIILGAVRINGMAEKLELSQQTKENVGENVYYLFQRILTQQPHLFSDLHIDLIILCCFRGVVKNLSFKEIIASYRMQPQFTAPVFHSEFVDWPLARLDWQYRNQIKQAHITNIAKFYNDIFFPYLKPLLLELDAGVTTARSYKIAEFNNENDDHLAQCPEPPFPSLPVMSVEEVSATHYACVSPMGSSEIIMLGAVRIRSMVEMLGLSQQIRENVYRLFESILHEQTSLFFNRHIDHIILCCFCAVAKISKLSLTFKEIISSYKKQPQCNPRVFDRVFVDWSLACPDSAFGKRMGQEHVDIVTFCNQIFIPSVEPLLLELGAEALAH